MKRVFMIHRWSGEPLGDWRAWLKTELEKQGYEVHTPDMPEKEEPVIEKWVAGLAKAVGTPDEETFFVGHSIGAQTIMRYLESVDVKVGGAIFVAGWFNLQNLEYGDVWETARPWIDTPIDFEKLKKVLPKSTLFLSDNDTYGCFEENKEKFAALGTKVIVLHKAGHISAVDGFTEFPQLLEEFKKLDS